MSALAPGLYRATVRGVPDVVVLVDDNSYGHHDTICGDCRHSAQSDIAGARPLIVLDLGSWFPLRAEEAAQSVRRSSSIGANSEGFLLDILDQIIEQTKPARIPEPGLWGVVEAGTAGMDGRRSWVRIHQESGVVWLAPGMAWHTWSELLDPVLIRPGIEES